jgi:hypothetical protein
MLVPTDEEPVAIAEPPQAAPAAEPDDDPPVTVDLASIPALRRNTGYGLIALSMVFWVAALAVPFTGLPLGSKAKLGGGLYAMNYVAFLSGVAVLGKPAYRTLKAKGKDWIAERWGSSLE